MGLFKKQRTDGITFDGQGDEREGRFGDIVQYNGEENDLVWRYPYDNLSTLNHVIVQEGQEAVFVSGGQFADVLKPGETSLHTNNIPILQRLLNLPFGGNSPFKASVIFVNTVTRVNNWGTKGLFVVRDKSFGIKGVPIKVGAYGNCGLRITDSVAFIREFSGTLHNMTAADFQEKFIDTISQYVKPCISKHFSDLEASITDITNFLIDIARFTQKDLNQYFEKYGITISDFNIGGINADEDDLNYQKILEAQTNAAAMAEEAEGLEYSRRKQGFTYQQERQFDIMEGAAQNEGSSGQMMGAGMGLGMGFGVGGAFGSQMGQMAGVMNAQPVSQQQNQVTPPPPPIQNVAFFALINNVQQGPYDMPTIANMINSGQITREVYVWKAGMPNWIKAGECQEIMQLFAMMPPPPPMGL